MWIWFSASPGLSFGKGNNGIPSLNLWPGLPKPGGQQRRQSAIDSFAIDRGSLQRQQLSFVRRTKAYRWRQTCCWIQIQINGWYYTSTVIIGNSRPPEWWFSLPLSFLLPCAINHWDVSLSLSFFQAITNATIHHHQCHHHKMTVIAMLSSGGTFAFIIVSHS